MQKRRRLLGVKIHQIADIERESLLAYLQKRANRIEEPSADAV